MTGIILTVMGFCTKLDYIFVLLPAPILGAVPDLLKQLPLVVGLLLSQPIIVGVTSLLILTALLPGRKPQPADSPLSVLVLDPAPAATPTLHSIGGSR
jgi:xanthine/uracil permease